MMSSRPFHFLKNRTLWRRFVFRRNNHHHQQTNETLINNPSLPKLNKSRSLLIVSAGSVLTYVGGSLVFGGENFYRNYAMPLVHSLLDGEDAHRLAVFMAKWNLVPIDLMQVRYPALTTEVFGLRFDSPLGLAAGFDKDGEAVNGLHNMGFAFVEVGSVTPLPQEGNPKPRVFRLPEDGAVINRYGFNSSGHDVVLKRLLDYRDSQSAIAVHATSSSSSSSIAPATTYTRNSLPQVIVRDDRDTTITTNNSNVASSATVPPPPPPPPPSAILGVNLGKNKTSPSPIGDYVSGVEKFASVADYLVVNVSSPNTPGLRDMQAKATLEALIDAVLEKLRSLPMAGNRKPPLLIKIAPDLNEEDVMDVVDVLLERSGPDGVAGVIISNTTISRPDSLRHQDVAKEIGGLSGKPLRDLSTIMIDRVYRLSGGKIPIIGCGGISTGADAYEKILAGASLVQIYSALVYGGPPVVKAITRELNELLLRDGFRSVEEAVGAGNLQGVDMRALRDYMEDMCAEKYARQEAALKEKSSCADVDSPMTGVAATVG